MLPRNVDRTKRRR